MLKGSHTRWHKDVAREGPSRVGWWLRSCPSPAKAVRKFFSSEENAPHDDPLVDLERESGTLSANPRSSQISGSRI